MAAGSPQRTPSIAVDEAMASACEGAGLTLDEMRGAFTGKRGKPTVAQRELRARVREALQPVYEAGHAPTKMAEISAAHTSRSGA